MFRMFEQVWPCVQVRGAAPKLPGVLAWGWAPGPWGPAAGKRAGGPGGPEDEGPGMADGGPLEVEEGPGPGALEEGEEPRKRSWVSGFTGGMGKRTAGMEDLPGAWQLIAQRCPSHYHTEVQKL